jgi:heme-degrading monooxygenase HmoA
MTTMQSATDGGAPGPNRRNPTIARVWHAWTANELAAEYERYVAEEVIPGFVAMPGFIGASYHRRDLNGEVEFLVITRWESFDAIVAFAGAANPSQTTIPQKAADMLLRCDSEATHYEDIPIAWRDG